MHEERKKKATVIFLPLTAIICGEKKNKRYSHQKLSSY